MDNILFSELMQQHKLPELLPRAQMLDILFREEYGYLPPKPENLHFTV